MSAPDRSMNAHADVWPILQCVKCGSEDLKYDSSPRGAGAPYGPWWKCCECGAFMNEDGEEPASCVGVSPCTFKPAAGHRWEFAAMATHAPETEPRIAERCIDCNAHRDHKPACINADGVCDDCGDIVRMERVDIPHVYPDDDAYTEVEE